MGRTVEFYRLQVLRFVRMGPGEFGCWVRSSAGVLLPVRLLNPDTGSKRVSMPLAAHFSSSFGHSWSYGKGYVASAVPGSRSPNGDATAVRLTNLPQLLSSQHMRPAHPAQLTFRSFNHYLRYMHALRGRKVSAVRCCPDAQRPPPSASLRPHPAGRLSTRSN